MNNIMISGILKGEKSKGYRKLQFALIEGEDEKTITEINCLYWTLSDNNCFVNLANNTQVFIKGHLGFNKLIGIHLVVEEFEKITNYENLAVH